MTTPNRTTSFSAGAVHQKAVAECEGDNHRSSGSCNPADTLLARMDGVRATGRNQWIARCPAHNDRTPSLSVRETDDRILVYCHAGCGAADVVHAVGLELRDLFPAGSSTHRAANSRRTRHRVDWRAVVFTILHDLTVITLAAGRLRRHELLDDDEDAALDRALETIDQAVKKAGGA